MGRRRRRRRRQLSDHNSSYVFQRKTDELKMRKNLTIFFTLAGFCLPNKLNIMASYCAALSWLIPKTFRTSSTTCSSFTKEANNSTLFRAPPTCRFELNRSFICGGIGGVCKQKVKTFKKILECIRQNPF